MATTIITGQPIEHVYTALAGQTHFSFGFQIFNGVSDLVVTIDGLPTRNFFVYLMGPEGGSIEIGYPIQAGAEVIIRRELAFERVSQFPSSGPLAIAALNNELNRLVGLVQQVDANLFELEENGIYTEADARAVILATLLAGPGIKLSEVDGKLKVEVGSDKLAELVQPGAGIELLQSDGKLYIGTTGGGGGSFTSEDIRQIVAAFLKQGSNVALTHDDNADTLTIGITGGTYTDENARDAIAQALTVTAPLGKLVNDAGDTIALSLNPAKVLQLPVMAAAMTPRASGGAALSTSETGANKINLPCLDFDGGTPEYAQFLIPMPKSWNEGTVSVQFLWTAGSTGAVAWACRAVSIGDDDALDASFGAAVTVADAVTAPGNLMASGFSAGMTVGGNPQAEDLVCFEVYRDAIAGGDTLAGDARLIGVRLKLTLAAHDDA